jgi:hypothetical protein
MPSNRACACNGPQVRDAQSRPVDELKIGVTPFVTLATKATCILWVGELSPFMSGTKGLPDNLT